MAGRALWLAVALLSMAAPGAGIADDTKIRPPSSPVPDIPVPAPKTAPLPDITPRPTVPAPPPVDQSDAAKAAKKDTPQPPKNLEPIPKDQATSVLGKKVLGPDKEDMGRVVDLLLDHDGRLRSVVIDFGGFLGVGSRKIAIDWRLVRFVPDNPDAPLALSLGKTDVQAAPEYKDTAQPPVMVGPQPPVVTATPQPPPQSQSQPQPQPPAVPAEPQPQPPPPVVPAEPQPPPPPPPQPQPPAAPDAAR